MNLDDLTWNYPNFKCLHKMVRFLLLFPKPLLKDFLSLCTPCAAYRAPNSKYYCIFGAKTGNNENVTFKNG